MTSCVANQEKKNSRYRDKTTDQPRIPKEKGENEGETTPNQTETEEDKKLNKPNNVFVLPIQISEEQKSVKFESKDNKEIQVSVAEGDITILAPVSGTFSITELSEEKMLIRLLSSDSYIFHILLNRSQTTLKTPKDTDKIKQSQVIAKTSHPFSFYAVLNDKKIPLICLNEITSDKVTIVNKVNLEKKCD